MSDPYDLVTAPPARRALSEQLPPDVALAAVEFITGPLLDNPRRVGKPLTGDLAGIRSARLGRWRVLYEINETSHKVIVLAIGHRRSVYRPR